MLQGATQDAVAEGEMAAAAAGSKSPAMLGLQMTAPKASAWPKARPAPVKAPNHSGTDSALRAAPRRSAACLCNTVFMYVEPSICNTCIRITHLGIRRRIPSTCPPKSKLV